MTNELSSLGAIGEVLGIAIATYLGLVFAAQLLRRVRDDRFPAPYHAFALATGVLIGLHVVHWESPWRARLLEHVTALTVVLAAIPIVALLNRVLWQRRAPDGRKLEMPKVLADATLFVVLAILILTALQFVYDVQVPGLLAGSGVVALVLGLGMQDQLHNLFAGISIHFTRPFKVGDWLLIDGHHARVIEISWRDTRLLTTDEMMIEIGNAEISKQIITNFEEPTPRHAVRATIGLHYNVPPARAQAVLKEAAASVRGVCADPAPVVFVKDFADSAVVYEIKVWIDDHALTSRVLSDVRSHAWYAVNRAGMEIPYPQLTIHRARPVDGAVAARQAATAALQAHPIFGFLTADQLESVVNESRVQLFAPTERLIEQGATGASLFALVHGQVEVHLRHEGISNVVAKLGPGDCVGEMSLLAGEPRTASVIAVNEVEAIEITKATFAALLRNNPHVIERLGELLAKRQMANAQHVASANGATVEQVRRGMVARLQAFFALG